MKHYSHTLITPLLSEAIKIFQIPASEETEHIKQELLLDYDGGYFRIHEYYISSVGGRYLIMHITDRSPEAFNSDEKLRTEMDQKLCILIGNTKNSIVVGYFLSGICVGEYEYKTEDFAEKSILKILQDIENLMLQQRLLFAKYKLPEEIFLKNSSDEFTTIVNSYFRDRLNPKVVKVL